jgi:GrpB-like predicted nucleotidyltransferase (UPF0157 family)
MNKYVFREYDRKYPELFEKEKSFLIRILPGVFGLEHVGSTAVPGLGGKGIIDILVSFRKKGDLISAEKVLLKNNYIIMTNLSGDDRVSFKVSRGFLFRKHFHIHLTLIGSDVWKQAVKFRDKLKSNPKLLSDYVMLKKRAIIIAKGEGKIYRKLKEAFIKKHSK